MLRINQFAKELGVTNHDVIEALEKRMGIPGKSHSSNLTDDQIAQLRRVFDAKSKGMEEGTPLALHKPSAPVRIVKATTPPVAAPAPAVAPPAQPPVLVRRPEPVAEPAEAPQPAQETRMEPEPQAPSPAPASAPVETPAPAPTPVAKPEPPKTPAGHEFSRLRVSSTPAPAPKPQEPAR